MRPVSGGTAGTPLAPPMPATSVTRATTNAGRRHRAMTIRPWNVALEFHLGRLLLLLRRGKGCHRLGAPHHRPQTPWERAHLRVVGLNGLDVVAASHCDAVFG